MFSFDELELLIDCVESKLEMLPDAEFEDCLNELLNKLREERRVFLDLGISKKKHFIDINGQKVEIINTEKK